MTEDLGKVIEVLNPSEVVVNRGSEHGVVDGQRVVVFAFGQNLTDPETGEDLGPLELLRGRGEVHHTQKKVCTVRSTETKRAFKERLRKKIPNAMNQLSLAIEPFEYVTEPIEVDARFENIQVGDWVRF